MLGVPWSPCCPSHAATAPIPRQHMGRAPGPPEASLDSNTEPSAHWQEFPAPSSLLAATSVRVSPTSAPSREAGRCRAAGKHRTKHLCARYYSCTCETRSVYSACHMPRPVVVLGQVGRGSIEEAFPGQNFKAQAPTPSPLPPPAFYLLLSLSLGISGWVCPSPARAEQ